MPSQVNPSTELDPEQVAFLSHLEQQIKEDLEEIRAYDRMAISAGVAVSPADSSRAGESVIAGQTVNLSRGGCMVEVSAPPQVGDHYRIQIVGIDVAPILTFARCVRVVLLKDETFEAGFQFFAPLDFSSLQDDN